MMHPVLIAKHTINRKYKDMSPERKRKLTLIVIIMVLLLIYRKRIVKSIKGLFHKDINKLEVNQSNLSYSKGEYYSMCSTLEASMNGWGTQVSPIMEVFKRLKTLDDWNFLQKSFGEREKEGGFLVPNITGDLKYWLSDELSSSDMEAIRELLQQNGINY
jgi:hypothetical protein